MTEHIIAWDLETIPDLQAAARALDANDEPLDRVRELIGDDFPKLPLHKIACIGALIAHREDNVWIVDALGAPHIGQRTEAQIIQAFVDKIGELKPKLVTYNGNSFDLPVLRYRAMINRLCAPGLRARQYFYRYSDDALDLCDALSSYEARAKVKLSDLSKMIGLPGKPDGMDGSQVESYVNNGRISEVAAYCESDVVNTYRIWLVYQCFLGQLTPEQLSASEDQLDKFLNARLLARSAAPAAIVSASISRAVFEIE